MQGKVANDNDLDLDLDNIPELSEKDLEEMINRFVMSHDDLKRDTWLQMNVD